MPIACAAMGMILLAGIVVNNSILLVDFIETARSNGADIHTAIEEAIRRRELLPLNKASFRGRGILVAFYFTLLHQFACYCTVGTFKLLKFLVLF